jgi:long-chain acyl-CoA synthetase
MALILEKSIYSLLREIASAYGEKPALFGRKRTSEGELWSSLSPADVRKKAEALAHILLAMGLKKGDRVLLLANSTPEYAVGFFGVPLAGGILVPVDVRLSLPDQKFISEYSEAKFIICTTTDSSTMAEKIRGESSQAPQVINIESLSSEVVGHADLEKTVLGEDEVFIYAFTSGTTSDPKAVMLTFANIAHQVNSAVPLFRSNKSFRLLSILPLHHMFEITMGFLLPFSQGGEVFFANSMLPHQIISFFKTKKIRDLLVVPLFLRALKKGIESEIQASKAKQIWFSKTYQIAQSISSLALRRLLFMPIHRKLGGELHQIISGASALDLEVGRFFAVLGIPVYEGYGLTETSPVISACSRKHNKEGTVGLPFPNVEVKIDPNTQEILVRGPNVMKGYYKNPEATAACISSDGWFNTGDVGHIDEDGFISIQGRIKDLIVLGSGKKVAPEEVEPHFRDIPKVQEFCIIGTKSEHGATQGTEIVTAVVVLNPMDISEKEKIQKKLIHEALNLSYYKRPTRFVFLTEPLPKTTTLKIKKNLVKELILKQRNHP